MRATAIAVFGMLLAGRAAATTHLACVGSAGELTNALAALPTSTNNDDAYDIRIRVGTYFAPSGGWIGSVTDHHDLTIRGGYTDSACSRQSMDASQTILDGNHSSGVLTIDTPGLPHSNIEISGLTFQNGSGSNAFESNAGGLKVGDPNPISEGNILIERNIFRHNTSTGNASSQQAVGGLVAATDGPSLIVRDNLFVDNSAPFTAAAYFYSNNAIDFSNNTLTLNRSTQAGDKARVAVNFFSGTGLEASNNIFWGNTTGPGTYDIDLGGELPEFGKGAKLLNNDVETSTGTAISSAGTLHVDPAFAGSNDFRLSAASPLIDAGAAAPPGGLGSVDLGGHVRVAGSAVDLGAYESAPTAGAAITPAISGAWYDAQQSGHGFLIEILPNNMFLAVWFVFAPDGTAQNWIYAQTTYDPTSSTVTISGDNLFVSEGGMFPPNFDGTRVHRTPWGTMTFTFTDCNTGSVTWNSTVPGFGSGTLPLTRLANIAGLACPSP